MVNTNTENYSSGDFPAHAVQPKMAQVPDNTTDVDDWVAKCFTLVEQERTAEVEAVTARIEERGVEAATAQGWTVPHCAMAGVSTGLYGRTLVTLRARDPSALAASSVSTGTIVGLAVPPTATSAQAVQVCSGVVTRVDDVSVVVAVDDVSRGDIDTLESCGARIRLNVLADDVTYRRLKRALACLRDAAHNPTHHSARLIDLMFNWEGSDMGWLPRAQRGPASASGADLQWHNQGLNDAQQAAVRAALASNDLCVVHGPPGTGKTATLTEIVVQLVRAGQRVLVTAPSNTAADNVLERVLRAAPAACAPVRLGHPARVSDAAAARALDAVVEAAPGQDVLVDVRKELRAVHSQLYSKATRRTPGLAAELKASRRALQKELAARERALVHDIVATAPVVVATNTGVLSAGALSSLLGSAHKEADSAYAPAFATALQPFDVVVIDEVGQGTEVSCWLPLLCGRRAIIAGDHKQLPPTIQSEAAAAAGLQTTLMDRAVARFTELPPTCPRVVHLLNMQYRMHQVIMCWASDAMYGGQLVAAESVATHTLQDLAGPSALDSIPDGIAAAPSPNLAAPCVLISTDGCDCEEQVDEQTTSKRNPGEAAVAASYVASLLQAGVSKHAIALITPYSAQVQQLRAALGPLDMPARAVRTVDGYQGQESEVVILSMVRSNRRGHVGFLSDDRRINVAVTRARRQVVVIGDTTTLSRRAFLGKLVQYFEEAGELLTADQFLVQQTSTPAGSASASAAAQAQRPRSGPPPKLDPAWNVRLQAAIIAATACFVGTGAVAKLLEQAGQTSSSKLGTELARTVSQHPAWLALRQAITVRVVMAMKKAAPPDSEPWLAQCVPKLALLSSSYASAVMRLPPGAHPKTMQWASMQQPVAILLCWHGMEAFERAAVHAAAEHVGAPHGSWDGDSGARVVGVLPWTHVATSVKQRQAAAQAAARSPAASEPSPSGSSTAAATSSTAPPVPPSLTPTGAANTASSAGSACAPARPEPAQQSSTAPKPNLLAQLAAERRAREAARKTADSIKFLEPAAIPAPMPKPSKKRPPAQQRARGVAKGSQAASIDSIATKVAGRSAAAAPAGDSEVDSDEALLDAVIAQQGQHICAAADCSKPTRATGSTCPHCKMRYCIEHGLPEAHGCGHAARAAARTAWLSNAGGTARAGLRGQARAAAQRQLHDRLDKASAARTGASEAAGKDSKKKKSRHKKRK